MFNWLTSRIDLGLLDAKWARFYKDFANTVPEPEHLKGLLVYVAGPIKGNTTLEVRQNICHAAYATLGLMARGYWVFCPHTQPNLLAHSNYTKRWGGYDTWMPNDLAILKFCDILFLLSGSEDSKGAGIEINSAMKMSIPVVHEPPRPWATKFAPRNLSSVIPKAAEEQAFARKFKLYEGGWKFAEANQKDAISAGHVRQGKS